MPEPLISICIPAYKRVENLKRLLESVKIQSFSDFEVVVTDDTPDDSIQKVCLEYAANLPLQYFKNETALGTPENWNEAIRRAKGKWIKIMHDDDWFAYPHSLKRYYELATLNEETNFVFSGSSIYKEDKYLSAFGISYFSEKLIRKDPRNLFYRNSIGPPSVTLHRNDKVIWYDKNMKWLVDIDFYIRQLQPNRPFEFTRELLVNVGFNAEQVTNQVIGDKMVVITESFLLLSKTGPGILNRIWNYDFAWRLMRNYHIRDMNELASLRPENTNSKLPFAFLHILSAHRRIPGGLLKIGFFSKIFMILNYSTFHLFRLKGVER